jgi:integrase
VPKRRDHPIPQVHDACDIVPVEASSGGPSKGDFESMARRRYQKPSPRKEGKQWVLYYWADEVIHGKRRRKKKRHVLGPGTMREREAERFRDEFLRPVNQGLVTIGSAIKFEDFVDTVYIPVVLPTMAKSTRDRSTSVYKLHLKPEFGALPLRDISKLGVQRYVSGLARSPLSQESKDKVRDVLSSIMQSAVEYGFIVKNPAEGVRLPVAKSGKRRKPFVTQEQLNALVAKLPEPYATMVYTAAYTGLRPSELVALRRRNVDDHSITIEERCSRGDWGAPKSEASNATVPVNRAVIERIRNLDNVVVQVKAGKAKRKYLAVKRQGPDDLVFQSPVTGAAVRDNNVLVRHIKPAARELEIPWVNWQVFRRSFATWLKMKGADVKDAQALMRHSKASTTLDVYQQFVIESQRRVVDGLVN